MTILADYSTSDVFWSAINEHFHKNFMRIKHYDFENSIILRLSGAFLHQSTKLHHFVSLDDNHSSVFAVSSLIISTYLIPAYGFCSGQVIDRTYFKGHPTNCFWNDLLSQGSMMPQLGWTVRSRSALAKEFAPITGRSAFNCGILLWCLEGLPNLVSWLLLDAGCNQIPLAVWRFYQHMVCVLEGH